MKIICDREENQVTEDLLRQMTEGAVLCVQEEGIPAGRTEISLTFVMPEEIKSLNHTYRGIDRTTDVLSFPQFDDLNDIGEEEEIILGDVVICREQALQQAAEFGHSPEREIVYLFVHSVCHLLGYDHMAEDEKAEMRAKEERVMSALGLQREEEEQSEYKELFRTADKAKANAYAPFSGFHVGAALLARNGQVFTGVNVENSSYGAAICAERTAFVKGISEGVREFEAIAVAADGGEALPCGICRQFMYEFEPELLVITGKDEQNLRVQPLSHLLPEGFRLEEKE